MLSGVVPRHVRIHHGRNKNVSESARLRAGKLLFCNANNLVANLADTEAAADHTGYR